jgi:hypothetical protein
MSEINAAAASHEENVLRRKSDDVGWEYGSLVDPSKLDSEEEEFDDEEQMPLEDDADDY